MSPKPFAILFCLLAVLLLAGTALLGENFKTVAERMNWFLIVSGGMLGIVRFVFVLFSYGRHRDE